ncbi:membrane protein [Mycolicibacterium cyprinidarum]|uniref:Membrane protein n=1 Tax=Mycolicibacterium cyprinidarum TaxID=2860311 RepID=A0ABQ4V5Q2_9MYCO|nr:membrane protein [Mycolicibacterium sp. NGTWSNA01]GJF10625.1 membrane protein [Mycolicibacterium sp. NGTWS1803]GJF20009.1 membrane protein [Mycolicibacterium sp. NGTWS0302]
MILTGRTGLIAILCAFPIAFAARPALAFTVLLTLLVVAVAVDVALAGSPRSLALTRSGPTSARLGQPVAATLMIDNGGRSRFRGVIRDAWPPSARAEPRTHPVALPAGQRVTFETQLRPMRRGDQVSALITARSVGPLGLAGRQGSHSVPWQIRILPPFLSRKHLPSRLARLRELEGMTPVRIRGQGTEFDSLREYVVGDDVRSIDWRATARRADVVVRTWRPERDRRVVIVLDTGRTSAGRVGVDPTDADPGGWPRLDWSMDAALLLAALAARAGDHVDFLAHDRVTRAGVFNASRTELLAHLVEAMAPLEPALIESDPGALVAAVLRRSRRRALVVLLTDLNASAIDEGLLKVLPQLTAKHQVLLAAVADPRVDTLAAGRADAVAVYDAAAAERARNERRDVASRLRRCGVDVVDAPPEELAPELADHYLAMKASGRL